MFIAPETKNIMNNQQRNIDTYNWKNWKFEILVDKSFIFTIYQINDQK